MTVKDYANESGFSVQEVLDKCKELDIKCSNADDYLDDDGIIMLDNLIRKAICYPLRYASGKTKRENLRGETELQKYSLWLRKKM